jgi:uncharacterized protein involved in response to NO
MATSAQQIRDYRGPTLLSYGFRPFFLFGAIWAALAVAIWLPFLAGAIRLPTEMAPIQWHAHELIFGYVPAVVAGFLLTAVPNWTGRLPVTGMPLAALFAIWVAGRAAILFSALIGARLAAVIDLAFLAGLAALIGREIVASKKMNNLKVLVLVGLLLAGNIAFHAEALLDMGQGHGVRTGIAATVMLIMVIGGRIIPSFTRNWLARQSPGPLPAPFNRFDLTTIGVAAGALIAWVTAPAAPLTALLSIAAAALHAFRLARWTGYRTAAEPLVLILHVAYAFVPLGFALVAAAILRPGLVLPSGALHAWTAGAVALMTLAVMTRASLGHTGHPLTATRAIQAIYAASVVAALLRIIAAFGLAREPLLQLSALAWVVAFGGFVIVYGPLLTRNSAPKQK